MKPAACSGYKNRQNFARQCRCRWYRSRQKRHSDVVRCHDRMMATDVATTSRSSSLRLGKRSRSEPPAFLWSRFSLQQGQDRDVAGRKARRFRCHTAVFALPGHAMHHDQPECLCQMRRGGLICLCVVRGLRCQMAARPSARPALLHLPSSSTAISVRYARQGDAPSRLSSPTTTARPPGKSHSPPFPRWIDRKRIC